MNAVVIVQIAGPVNAAGQAYDPAAETYKKQVNDSFSLSLLKNQIQTVKF